MRWSTFGLPHGTAIVLVALLNTVFTVQSFMNIGELAFYKINFLSYIFRLISAIIQFILTSYFWIAVVFKGRGCHLVLWIAASIAILLIHSVISSWYMISAFSTKDNNHLWNELWNLLLSIVLDVYIIFLTQKAANILLRSHSSQQMVHSERQSLIPIKLGYKGLWKFYEEHCVLTAKLFLTLDIILSLFELLRTEHPLSKLDSEGYGWFPDGAYFLSSLLENVFLRILRVIVDVSILWLLAKKPRTQVQGLYLRWLRFATWTYITLIALSLGIFISLYGTFDNLTVTIRFRQVYLLTDIIFRNWILYILVRCIESERTFPIERVSDSTSTVSVVPFLQGCVH